MPVIRHGKIKEPSPNETIWRYMSLFKFKDLLATSQLYLCRLDKFESDPLDGAIPEINYDANALRDVHMIDLTFCGVAKDGQIRIENNSRKQSVPLREYYTNNNFESSVRNEELSDLHNRKGMFASCWHKNSDESPVFWKNYKSEPAVAIKSSVLNLVKSVYQNRENLYVCDVQYFKKGESIPSQNVLYQAAYKRSEFAFEKEVRLIYWCHKTTNDGKTPSEDYRIKIDIKELISEVWVSPFSDEKCVADACDLMRLSGLNALLKQSRVSSQ